MASATVVRAWRADGRAHLAVRVAEADGANVEYIGSTALEDLQGLTVAEQKAKLVAAVKAVRDARVSGPQDIAGITGTVTI